MRMKNSLLALLIVSIVSCRSNEKKPMSNIDQLLDSYYEERLQYFPLEATAIADNRYNDKLPAEISESYRKKLKVFYKKYLDEIEKIDRSVLGEQDALSYDVFNREMKIQLEGLEFKDY